MSEKQFTLEQWTEKSLYFSDGEYSAHMSIEYICKEVEKKLNEQQELIEELHISDHMGWGRAEKFEKELKQKKIYIKRLEYKVQKFKEMNGEQQATIRRLQDLCGESDSENAKLRIENKKLKAKLKEKEEDEKLYANEIVELRKTNEEWLQFKDLGGDY